MKKVGFDVKRTLHVVIEEDVGGGFIASVVELPGCHTQAETLEELRTNVKEAIELYLEGQGPSPQLPTFVGVETVEASI